MPHPFVTTATVKDDLIEITVEFDYSDSGTYVEVSGSATQSGGAFANFYDIAETTPGLTGPTGAFPTVNVSAHPLPPNNFRKDEDVTFVIRVSKVWLTVLGPQGSTTTSTEDPGVPADQGTTWNVVRKQSHLDDDDDGGTGDAPDGAGAPQTAAAGR